MFCFPQVHGFYWRGNCFLLIVAVSTGKQGSAQYVNHVKYENMPCGELLHIPMQEFLLWILCAKTRVNGDKTS